MKKFVRMFPGILGLFFTLSLPSLAQSPQQGTPPYYNFENLRSDTFDVLTYSINLHVTDPTTVSLDGYTSIRFATKMNNQPHIRFDLLKLTIDSIKENTSKLSYAYNDTVVRVNFSANKNIGDTSILTIYYHGNPKIDPTGWGGVYGTTSQGYKFVFNLGVGFGAKPHNFGRPWFPCFDNFVERSKFDVTITSDSARKAYCGGMLISDVVTGANRSRRWVLDQTIPTYLASFALADYALVKWTANTLSGPTPLWLAAKAADTTALKNGFVNLKNCITGFENYFGPYKFSRFGFVSVPFNGGAMEHATNIAYPQNSLGSLAWEDLMAHELSHHWWGNLITCETPEDMWINEGWATFSADMFYEWQYGKNSYLQRVKSRHAALVHYLHHAEGGFRAISGVPHDLTYSQHVYEKGADMAHNLRAYLGDVDFFAGCKYVMQQKSFKAINSLELRNLFATSSGKNLNDFFNDWVFNGGWSHFSIDSVHYVPGGASAIATVYIKQKLYGAPSLHNNVPLEVSFFKPDWSRTIHTVTMSGQTQSFTMTVPTSVVYCALNYDSKLSDASTHEYKTIKTTGNLNLILGKLPLQVLNKGTDSSLVRVVHNFVKPDPFKQSNNHKLSNQHYWKVEGILSPGFHARGQFNYNGYKGTSGAYNYLDTLLAQVNGDSIALFYRPDASKDWKLVKAATKTKINAKSGHITTDTLKLGEYTFANLGDTMMVGIPATFTERVNIKVFPNPAKQTCEIELGEKPSESYLVQLYNIEGRAVLTKKMTEKTIQLDLGQLAAGAYTVTLSGDSKGVVYSQKLLIQ